MDSNSEFNSLDDLFSTLQSAETIEPEDAPQIKWLKQRWGKFTASRIGQLMSSGRNETFSKTATKYIYQVAAECVSKFHHIEISSPAIEWGKLHELAAIERFEQYNAIQVLKTGINQEFVLSECGDWGGSPDGIISNSGIEVKCPNTSTHLMHLEVNNGDDLKGLNPDYYYQILACMILTHSEYWYFVSYDPRMCDEKTQYHQVKIYRNQDDVELLLERIALAIIERDKIINRLSN